MSADKYYSECKDYITHTTSSELPSEFSTDIESKKFDDSKARWDLLDIDFVEGIVKVLTYGAKKYEDNNWRGLVDKNGSDRYYAALMRHIAAWRQGEKTDPESTLPHLYHAACGLYFLAHFDKILARRNK